MKFSILGFDQKKVLDLTERVNCNRETNDKIFLDIDDLLILSLIADMSNRRSIKKVFLDNEQYSWISYNCILEDLPLLRIGKKQLSRKLNKLSEFNLIGLKVERMTGTGTFIYIKLGSEYEGLLYNNIIYGQECIEGVDKNVHRGGQKCTPKDNITILYNNNNNNIEKESISKDIPKKEEKGNPSPNNQKETPLSERKSSRKREKTLPFDNEELRSMWEELIKYPEWQKKTDHAIDLRLKTLSKLANGDVNRAIAIVRQTLEKGWQDFYDVKEYKPTQQPAPQPKKKTKWEEMGVTEEQYLEMMRK